MIIGKQLKTTSQYYIVIFFVALFFSSCYEEKEGCLDIQSVNYDLSADYPCEDCCSYPSLTLWISHQADEQLLSFDSVYTNNLGQEYMFVDYKLVVSNFRFMDDGLNTYRSLDSIRVNNIDNTNAFFINEDIAVISRGSIQYNLGSFNASGNLERLAFDVGLEPTKRNIDLSSLADNHPLNDTLLLDDSGELLNGYFVLKNMITGNEIIILLQKEESNQEVYFDTQSFVNPGFSIELNLIIDYQYLLYTADFETDSNEMICNKLLLNIPTSFILQ